MTKFSPLDYASEYLDLGISIHPVCPPKHECSTPGKIPYNAELGQHMPNWQKHGKATSDILDRWKKSRFYKQANIGFLCGSPSRIISIDIDHPGLEEIVFADKPMPPTWEFATANGKRILYKMPDGLSKFDSVNVSIDNSPEIEIQGDGKQSVMPPSIHATGTLYEWRRFAPEYELALAPDWLLDLRPLSSSNVDQTKLRLIKSKVPKGGRNNAATKLAGHLLAPARMSPEETFALLLAWNDSACVPPLPEGEIRRIVESIAGRENKSQIVADQLRKIMQQDGSI